MAYPIDVLAKTQTQTKRGEWVISRPYFSWDITRIWDAILVLIGKADAVTFRGEK